MKKTILAFSLAIAMLFAMTLHALAESATAPAGSKEAYQTASLPGFAKSGDRYYIATLNIYDTNDSGNNSNMNIVMQHHRYQQICIQNANTCATMPSSLQ